MGEQRAVQDSTVSNQVDGIYGGIDCHLLIASNIVRLHSFCADNLMHIHNTAFGYTSCHRLGPFRGGKDN